MTGDGVVVAAEVDAADRQEAVEAREEQERQRQRKRDVFKKTTIAS